ncbi:WD40 repeat domain-containing protein [Streptomyces sp. MMG1121]|uniref:WD40 repeat domain-containing protein n=1 Tax=Streptomyces sp. MMG1121 TaxID=1415544 RepID=UPI0006AF02E8|nr:hypothetical protein [Streptomyces sp. MMG1121]KOV65250.1 hypothetical protein ADK64_15305 [Streptomyces sp. MMG1121]
MWHQTGRPAALRLRFSPDSRTLLDYGPYGLWGFDTLTGRQLYSVAGSNNYHVLATTVGSERAVTVDFTTLIVFDDLATGRVLRSIPDEGETRALSLAGDGRFAVAGVREWQVRVWDLDTGRLLRTLEGHPDTVRTAALSEDGRRLVSGDCHGTVRGWELSSIEFTREPKPGWESRR